MKSAIPLLKTTRLQEGHKHSTYLATDVGQSQVQCHTLSALVSCGGIAIFASRTV